MTPAEAASQTARKAQARSMLEGEVRRQTGKAFSIDWSALDEQSMVEALRLLRELQTNKDAAVRKAREQPWSR